MSDLNQTFTDLISKYKDSFSSSTHTGDRRESILAKIPKKAGVYVISVRTQLTKPLYIGSSGKVCKGLKASSSGIYSRMKGANTPYKFEGAVLRHGPTTATVPPAGYADFISLNDLLITCFVLPASKIPAAFEHLLIQGFINEFGDLPLINQKA